MDDTENTASHEITTEAPTKRRTAPRKMTKVSTIRHDLEMTQKEFADAYHIPLSKLRNWEQGYKKPDAITSAYLKVIGRLPLEIKGILRNRK